MKILCTLLLAEILFLAFVSIMPPMIITIVNEPKQVPTEIREVTAYNLVEGQTDDTPCMGAVGPKYDLCEMAKVQQLCATRAYPLWTELSVGGITCTVVDRPAAKYGQRIDLVLPTLKDAKR